MAQPEPRYTPAEYLALERDAATKSEYLDGEVVAMAGASRKDNLITGNVLAALHPQLRGRDCEVYSSDMRVRIPASNRYTYPDVAVVCGEPAFEDAELDTLTNPTLLLEVLSPSTEGFDWRKFGHYRTVPSLRVYLLVAQDTVHVDHFVRQDDGRWLLAEVADLGATLDLPEIGCTLALADVYDRVAFEVDPPPEVGPGPPHRTLARTPRDRSLVR